MEGQTGELPQALDRAEIGNFRVAEMQFLQLRKQLQGREIPTGAVITAHVMELLKLLPDLDRIGEQLAINLRPISWIQPSFLPVRVLAIPVVHLWLLVFPTPNDPSPLEQKFNGEQFVVGSSGIESPI